MIELLLIFIITFATLFFVAFLVNKQVEFVVLIFKIITTIFDVLTYPIYLFIDKPWRIQRHSKTFYADRKYEPNGDYTYWVTKPELLSSKKGYYDRLENLFIKVKHLSEFLPIALELYEDTNCIGRRRILRKFVENGKNKFELSNYEWINYRQTKEVIDNLTKILYHKFQFKRGDRIAMFAETGFEWFVTFLSLQNLGCQVVTLHSTLGELGIAHILNSTKIEYVFTQTDLARLLNKFQPNIQNVKKLINFKNHFVDQLSVEEKKEFKYELYEFDELLKESLDYPYPELKNSEFSTDDIAIIMYTSGSTGDPKGVLLTHENIIFSARCIMERVQIQFKMDNTDTFLAYLPMSHIFECLCELTFFLFGVKMAYGKAQTLITGAPLLAKGCQGDVQESKPTIWAGVPLIFERIQSNILNLLNKSPYISGIYKFAYEYKRKWSERGFRCRLIDVIFFKHIKDKFGGRLRLVIAGGAPLMLETQIFTKLFLDTQLVLAYASTESSSGCISAYDQFDHANTAALMEDVKLRLEDWVEGGYTLHDKPNPRGEIILGSKACSIGYFNNPEETDKAFFEENGCRWWRTGDIGEINKYGHLSLIDRKKDLVKLQMGEYIALGKAESVLTNCSYVDNIVLHGNSYHNHLVALVQPNKEHIIKLAESMGKNTDDLAKLYEDFSFREAVIKELTKYGKANNLLSKEIPYVIKLCTDSWTINNGLLTASLKISRKQIYSFYKDSIDTMYKELEKRFPIN